jgi:hypothetical protein
MPTANPRDYKIEPEFLGPLGDRPLAETARSGGPADLFPGASAFLNARVQRRRRDQWNAARSLAGRLLRPEEHVLYVAHAMHVPPALHALALGALALTYHQVMLVFTDTRLIEVLLSVRGKTTETRLRSFPWNSVRDLKISFSKLSVVPAHGKKQAWKVPAGGDRKLLKLLLPRLKTRLLQEGAATAQPLPLWHCPQCGATVPTNPRSCGACRTSFRSSRLAALLSLAFPGGGLFYAGHPFLAAADFLGEVVFYLIFLLMVLEAETGTLKVAVAVGAFLFILTKLESMHVSQILVARSKPETEARRTGYNRLALVGGLVSVLLIGGAFPLAGAARPVLDRDLDVAGEGSPWHGSRKVAEWTAFADDATARSQWYHADGLRVTLFGYPQGMLEGASEFRTGFRQGLTSQGVTIVTDDENVPAPFQGFRFVVRGQTKSGEPLLMVHYFVVDGQNHDIHQVVAAVIDDDATRAETLVRDFLSHARWVDPTPPERPAGPPQGEQAT